MKTVAQFILKIAGWKITGDFPLQYKKCIVIEAPHTSMWDFIYGWLGFTSKGINVRFLIKKESFVWPVGPLIKKLGGIPVDRQKNNNMVEQISKLFDRNESLVITITPEGTRKRVEHWKRGFYYIALHAKVPIILGYLDYEKKQGGLGPVLWPTGNFQEDWTFIEAFYKGKRARHPEMFNLS
ncbi:MAG: 1-acyl-sn-glycerol-3-phosphate acyltransferase [Bacteroidales bacterium]